jgi:hypothetical protein
MLLGFARHRDLVFNRSVGRRPLFANPGAAVADRALAELNPN